MGFRMRAFITALIAAALFTQVAYAQHSSSPGPGPSEKDKAAAQERRNFLKDTDEAYKSSLEKIPDAKKTDPWGSVRTPPAPAGNK